MKFSSRHNLGRNDTGQLIWDDIPEAVRAGLLNIMHNTMGWSYTEIRATISLAINKFPDPANWTEIPNVRDDVYEILLGSKWFEIMDIIEGVFNKLPEFPRGSDMNVCKSVFESNINELLLQENIGWHLVDGQLQARSDEENQRLFDEAESSLSDAGFSTSTIELQEAIKDISRRPEPDITGAIQHAMGALEAVSRVVSHEPKKTLGEIIKAKTNLFPKPLDEALHKMWGYCSNEGGRHGKEGHDLSYEEAFLVVGIASAMCFYIVKKHKN